MRENFAKRAKLKVFPRGYSDWQLASAAYSSQKLLKRRLGPTESSYYLGSRGEGKVGGVNDM